MNDKNTGESVTLCFFEDAQSECFKPLTLTRPMDDLRVGIYTIREKWLSWFGTDIYRRQTRPELKKLFAAGSGGPRSAEFQAQSSSFTTADSRPVTSVFWINSRLLPGPSLKPEIAALNINEAITLNGLPLLLKTDAETTRNWMSQGMNTGGFLMKETESKPALLQQLWDLLAFNASEIHRDIERTDNMDVLKPGTTNGIHVHGNHPVYIFREINLEPGLTFVTTEGPVYIGPRAAVMAGSLIRGPAAVCEGATVKMGAKIYENTTIGPVCKVGGEINNVIFHSYSNKAHDGYVGNSIFGQWCNLGADTNTSNLKNNYGTIRFTDWHTRREQDTGEQFLGTVMSDHGKTGINSMLTTGTNCGVCCNLFSHGYPPKLIPSFSWINSTDIERYRFDKAVETMERTMKRRDIELTDDYTELMRTIFESRDSDLEIL